MSEHLGKSAELVVATNSDVRNEQSQRPQKPQKAGKPNPARWVLQNDGRYRWWTGFEWTDQYGADPDGPDPTLAPAIELAQAATPVQPPADPVSQIKQLADLHAAGILTDDEFAAKKAEILSRM